MPNTVVPGNHDFDNATGEFAPVRHLLPAVAATSARPGRRARPVTAATWARTCSAPTRSTERNMDNFALFTAGGRDFLVLNLEWEAPRYALDWAAQGARRLPRPDRHHGHPQLREHQRSAHDGRRTPGGTPADTIWTDFVSTAVLDPAGAQRPLPQRQPVRGNRSDLNTCGQPVQQILTDYQDRANGGDGWLRYYTFDPAANTMTATHLLAEAEPVRDRRGFLLHPAVRPEPGAAGAVRRHRHACRSPPGQTAATTWTGLDPDTAYEWRAVAGDGTDTTTSPTWTVRTPASADSSTTPSPAT